MKTGVRLTEQLVANRHPSRKHTTHYNEEREYNRHSLKHKHLTTTVIPIREYEDRFIRHLYTSNGQGFLKK